MAFERAKVSRNTTHPTRSEFFAAAALSQVATLIDFHFHDM